MTALDGGRLVYCLVYCCFDQGEQSPMPCVVNWWNVWINISSGTKSLPAWYGIHQDICLNRMWFRVLIVCCLNGGQLEFHFCRSVVKKSSENQGMLWSAYTSYQSIWGEKEDVVMVFALWSEHFPHSCSSDTSSMQQFCLEGSSASAAPSCIVVDPFWTVC